MNKIEIKQRICALTEFRVPAVQKAYGLSYAEMKGIVDELVKAKRIEFVSGTVYKVYTLTEEERAKLAVYQPKNEQEKLNIQALWECIKKGEVSLSLLRQALPAAQGNFMQAVDWMEEYGFITSFPERKIVITREEFLQKFGNPDEWAPPQERAQTAENQKKTDGGLKALFAQRLEAYKKERQEVERAAAEAAKWNEGFRAALMNALKGSVKDDDGEEQIVVRPPNEPQVEFKYGKSGDTPYLSDGGKTAAECGKSKERIQAVLKDYAPVRLDDGGAITVPVTEPSAALASLLLLYAAVHAVKKAP